MIEKLTKIVATIGPATESEEMIEKLILNGANVLRFNTKHNTPEWHQSVIARVKKIALKMQVSISTLLDLQGPEIRINLKIDEFKVSLDEVIVFTSDKNYQGEKVVYIDQIVIDSLLIGHNILLDNGYCEFRVVEKETNIIRAKALVSCVVKQRKTMNIPSVTVDLPSLIDRDYQQLDGIIEGNVDYIALSFVRNFFDIENLRMEMKKTLWRY